MIDVSIKKQLGSFRLDVDFSSDHKTTGILGASGCGKSMTLKCIAGIERPDSGHIIINGRILFDSEKKIDLKPQKRRIGYLFQSYALFNTMTVEKNIMAGAKGRRAEKRKKASELIKMLELDGLEKKLPSQLSGGQQQRTALARLLASQPELILLDEAFSSLDGFLKERLQYEILGILSEFDIPAVIVSHDRDEIYKMTSGSVILHNGRVCADGGTKELFEHPKKLEAARITGCKNISPAVRTGLREVYASDWGCSLSTAEDVRDDIRFIGIRAHDIRVCKNNDHNSVHVMEVRSMESPFEVTKVLRTPGGGELWRKVSRDERRTVFSGAEYVQLPKECLLLLE